MLSGRHRHIPLHFPHCCPFVSEPNECERVSEEAARENRADSRQSGRIMLSPTRPQSLTAFWIIYILLYDQGRTSYTQLTHIQANKLPWEAALPLWTSKPSQPWHKGTGTGTGTLFLDTNGKRDAVKCWSTLSEPCEGGGEVERGSVCQSWRP